MAWADEQSTAHLMCRDTGIRHRWNPLTVRREGRYFIETLVCERCRTEKDRYLTQTGLVKKNKFRYPEGYVRQGEGRLTKAENAKIRMTALQRRMDS